MSGVYHTVQAAMAAHEGTFTHFSDLERWENNLDDNAYCTIAPYVVEGERAPVGTCETCQHVVNLSGKLACQDERVWVNPVRYHRAVPKGFFCAMHTPRPETPQAPSSTAKE